MGGRGGGEEAGVGVGGGGRGGVATSEQRRPGEGARSLGVNRSGFPFHGSSICLRCRTAGNETLALNTLETNASL